MANLTASKNLIMGCAFNYTNQDILPFLNSLQACGFTDDLVLLTNTNSNISLKGYPFKGRTINVEKAFRYPTKNPFSNNATELAETSTVERLLYRTLSRLQQEKNLTKSMVAYFYHNYFLMTSRYFLYYYYLLQWNYTNILLTDVNDVFFQKNLFDETYENGVTAFAEWEGITLQEEETNHDWIKETFGEKVLQSIGKKVVYCAGTIMVKNGTTPFLKDFLRIVIEQKVSPVIQGIDQGVFNYMVSYVKPDYFHRKVNGDTVLTVANVPESLITMTEKGMTLQGNEHLPAVVHQYTRFGQQKKYVVEKFRGF